MVEKIATDFKGATKEGIKIGSNEKQIIQAYGQPTRRSVNGVEVELRYKNPGLYFKLRSDMLIKFTALK